MSDEPPIPLRTYLGIRRNPDERIWNAVIDQPILTEASFMRAVNKLLGRPHLRLVQKQLEPPDIAEPVRPALPGGDVPDVVEGEVVE